MAIREKSPLLEASEALHEYRESFEVKRQKKIEAEQGEKARLENQIFFGTKEKREAKFKVFSEYSHKLKDELLAGAIKGIYIGALQENTALTDDGIALATSLVENYIKESGGATAILGKCSGKTYALDYIRSVVEGTYESIMEDVDPDNEETYDCPEEKKSEMYDDLNKEDDINKAVELIAQRITDAEEEFIKKNNEDKKTLEDIATRFSERIKNVENEPTVSPEDDPEGAEAAEEKKEEKIQQESRIAKRMSNSVKDNRSKNVFEQVVFNLTSSIIKDKSLREEYTVDGKLDMGAVIEASMCIYGLLETVNTLKLENVNASYIREALSTM